MLAEIKERNMDVHSLLVIRNGYLVSETYFEGYQPDAKHDMQSVGRSFTSALVGIAIDKGYIDGVDHRIIDFFPERTFANLDKQKEAMTLDDVLTMRSGLEWQETPDTRNAQQRSPDWIQFLLDKPVIAPPGSQWNYCSGCSHILSAILHETTGMNPRDFAEQYLFKPLGISDGQLDERSRGDSLRRRRIQSYAARHGQAGIPLSPEWTVGWTANRLLRVGGEVHADTRGGR